MGSQRKEKEKQKEEERRKNVAEALKSAEAARQKTIQEDKEKAEKQQEAAKAEKQRHIQQLLVAEAIARRKRMQQAKAKAAKLKKTREEAARKEKMDKQQQQNLKLLQKQRKSVSNSTGKQRNPRSSRLSTMCVKKQFQNRPRRGSKNASLTTMPDCLKNPPRKPIVPQSKPKFKKGDVVYANCDIGAFVKEGSIGKVSSVEDYTVTVEWSHKMEDTKPSKFKVAHITEIGANEFGQCNEIMLASKRMFSLQHKMREWSPEDRFSFMNDVLNDNKQTTSRKRRITYGGRQPAKHPTRRPASKSVHRRSLPARKRRLTKHFGNYN